jgi:hypothetical protein
MGTAAECRPYLIKLAPVTGIIITVVVTGRDVDGTGAGRIAVVAADIDPTAADPFLMSADPDSIVGGLGPLPIDGGRRRGRRRADADVDGGGGLG